MIYYNIIGGLLKVQPFTFFLAISVESIQTKSPTIRDLINPEFWKKKKFPINDKTQTKLMPGVFIEYVYNVQISCY